MLTDFKYLKLVNPLAPCDTNTLYSPMANGKPLGRNSFFSTRISQKESSGCQNSLLSDSNASSYELVKGTFDGYKITFAENDLKKAFRDGCFKIEQPSNLDFSIMQKATFYIADKKEECAVDPLCLSNSTKSLKQQIATFQNENDDRQDILSRVELNRKSWSSENLHGFTYLMNDIGMVTLESCFKELRIECSDWYKLSSGSIADEGTHLLQFSQYQKQGSENLSSSYVDMSYISVTAGIPSGFEIFNHSEKKYVPVTSDDNCLMVSFGLSLNYLTNGKTSPLQYRYRLTEDFASAKVFLSPNLGGYVWRNQKNCLTENLYTHSLEKFGKR